MQLYPFDLDPDALDELLHQFRMVYLNGGAEFARFKVVDFSLKDWFSTRTREAEQQFFWTVLTHPLVLETFAPLHLQPPVSEPPEVIAGSALTLDGELAQALVLGGAYTPFPGTGAEAKNLGQRFCQELFGDRYTDVQIYKSQTAWSPWFGGVMWDCTWLGLDLEKNQLWLLSLTDTD